MTERVESNTNPATAASQAQESRSPARARLIAALLLAGCLTVLGIATWLEPDPRGYGTAEQLGTGPCGVLVMTGLPCPTCGMTTAFAHTVRGQWGQAFLAQPGGFVLALATMGAAIMSIWVLLRGRWPGLCHRYLTPHRLFLALLVLLLGAWAFTICVGLARGTLPYVPALSSPQ